MHSLLHASLHFIQYQLRMHSNEQLVHIQIPIQDFENGTATCIESDEWKWNNEMYDIISSVSENGIVYATAFKDEKDKSIAKTEKKQQEKKHTHSENNIILFCAELPKDIVKNKFIFIKHKYLMYSDVLKFGIADILIPPPNYC
jgi:hypothetical protein